MLLTTGGYFSLTASNARGGFLLTAASINFFRAEHYFVWLPTLQVKPTKTFKHKQTYIIHLLKHFTFHNT